MFSELFLFAFVPLVLTTPPPTPDELIFLELTGKLPTLSLNHTLHSKKVNFKKYYIGGGTFTKTPPTSGYWLVVEATPSVSDYAHYYATDIAYQQTRHMPADIFQRLARNAKVGVFTKHETLTIFPEYAYLADRQSCHNICTGSCATSCTIDGRKYSTLAGTGGKVAAIVDDNVLCNSQDPYRHNSNILVHEFAHTIHRHGLSSALQSQVSEAYTHARSARLWTLSDYAMANEEEYWAEGTQVFFNCEHLQRTTGGMNTCNTGRFCRDEQTARSWLHRHDPKLYNLLSLVYTNNRPSTPGNIKICMTQ